MTKISLCNNFYKTNSCDNQTQTILVLFLVLKHIRMLFLKFKKLNSFKLKNNKKDKNLLILKISYLIKL